MTIEGSITLRQGLEKFYKENEIHLNHNKKSISNEAAAFFRSHDIAHVLFGCDISLLGEGSVKIWTIFGTTLGFWNHIRGYQDANAFELSKAFNFSHFVGHIFELLITIPSLIIKARNMHKPWPWSAFDSYLDTSISEIRKEFNIIVN